CELVAINRRRLKNMRYPRLQRHCRENQSMAHPCRIVAFAFILAHLHSAVAQDVVAQSLSSEIVSVRKLWDVAPHNAFTDMIRWRDHFVCAFREGRGHASTDGSIRVLASSDMRHWQSVAQLSLTGYDLRDASLSVTPDDRLLLNGGAAPRQQDGQSAPTGSFVAFADELDAWTKPQITIEPGRWLWRLTWHDGRAWGVEYGTSQGAPHTSLKTTIDGLHYQTHVERMCEQGRPTEAVLRLQTNGTMLCLQRRDGREDKRSAYLGTSSAPYQDWHWRDLGVYFGGPNLLSTDSGHWLACGRMFRNGKPVVTLAELDLAKGALLPLCDLPSGGDCSYPGLCWHDDRLWVSYYSSHEGRTSIYLAEIRVTDPQ
ncbi:MAG: hypothetical protein KDA61_20260, partial [Planctomycetales bacterium]|nr:hypothetical protein [Planctomycetales bacterium]